MEIGNDEEEAPEGGSNRGTSKDKISLSDFELIKVGLTVSIC